jgi:hypothetical protein
MTILLGLPVRADCAMPGREEDAVGDTRYLLNDGIADTFV